MIKEVGRIIRKTVFYLKNISMQNQNDHLVELFIRRNVIYGWVSISNNK